MVLNNLHAYFHVSITSQRRLVILIAKKFAFRFLILKERYKVNNN